jgi:hypothetical protein
MNLNRILINESEKKRILEMHSGKKSLGLITEGFNPADQVFTLDVQQSVQATRDFGTVFPKTVAKGTRIYRTKAYDKLYLSDTGFVMYCDRDLFVYKDGIDDLRIGAGDVRNNSLRKILGDIYCNGKKLKNWDELKKGSNEKDSPTNPIKKPINEPKKDINCRNKSPYNAFTDAGLNWKKERQKWIDAKCNGTTPCILGDAQTNINLRNAFCDGTWGSKKGQDDGKQTEGCKEKCSIQPKEVPAGSIVTQQIGYFYNSTKGMCVGVTGQNGPFTSMEDCEKCKCGSSQQDGNKGNDSWSKYPCVIRRINDNTLTKSKDFGICGCYQLTETCVIFSDGTAWCEGTSGKGDLYYYQCFVDEIRIIKEKPIQVGIDRPNKPIKGGDELPVFIPPIIAKQPKSFD